jgi:hypothetical protein
MGVYKELDITYQEIVEKAADQLSNGQRIDGAESRIWKEIGKYDFNLADELVDEYPYEAALVCIERGEIPHDNPEWQRLVVRLAYNAITRHEDFLTSLSHSRFSIQEVQSMIDLAAGAVLQHPNFRLTGFKQLAPKS